MSEKWNILDEFQRIVATYAEKPPTITQLLDEYYRLVPPAARAGGWTSVTDSPRAATPPPASKESPMASSTSMPVTLFKCPGCKTDISGILTLKPAETQPDVDPLDSTFVVHMTVAGVRVDHNCVPKVTRSS